MRCCIVVLFSGFVALSASGVSAEEALPPPRQFSPFVKRLGLELRKGDAAPLTMDEWQHRRALLKDHLVAAWGGFPETPCDLEPRKFGEFEREGYRVEKLMFQTRPGVWMTANAYVPSKQGRLPAILNVHGHWAGAKQDPIVQSRCIAAAKLGFFVLSVDAFGAGERAVGKKLGEYHGEMVAATLLPVGLPLAGLQVYENMRAVDYLCTRPEVDSERIGITGASGGGNQTMYAGAFDERFRCVVPTCSVGSYQAYLSAACCMCEVVPGALTFTEEGDVLGLAANRGLMVTSATRDAFQFSVDEAKKSVARAEAIAKLFKDATVRHTIIESEHNYNQPMREAMLGWMTKLLKGEGDGSPVTEPTIETEDPELLRCFPGDTRPDDFVTIPRFAAAEAERLLAKIELPTTIDGWNAMHQHGITELQEALGDMPNRSPLNLKSERDPESKLETLTFEPESGLTLTLKRNVVADAARIALILDMDGGAEAASTGKLAEQLRASGWMVVGVDLRATGNAAVLRDSIARAPDHNTAEWSLWIGRPLLGQWAWDVQRSLDALKEQDGKLPEEITVIGLRTAGLVALCAGVLDDRIARVATVNSLGSYVTDQPYVGQRLGLMAPAILRDVGDVPHLAALMAPRPVLIAGAVSGSAKPYGAAALKQQFQFTKQIFELVKPEPEPRFRVTTPDELPALLK